MTGKNYKPVGKCIYCGAIDKKLTDEHIIAYGLNANSILPEASCEACNNITKRIEGRVMRGFTWQMRTALGFQTRRPKEVPKTFPLGIVRDSKEEIIDVPVKDHFIVLPMPLFKPPAYLDNHVFKKNRDYKESIELAAIEAVWFSDPEEIRKLYNAERIFVTHWFDHIAFAQMLGKIAYCLTVAELGLDAIDEAYVLPAILGEHNDIGQWVGSSDNVLGAAANVQHTTQVQTYKWPDPNNPDGFIIALLRLFSHIPSPGYMVIVGRPR
jgi:hypothetical protein